MKTRLFSIVTSSHRSLLDNWFAPTVPDDFELTIDELPQQCSQGNFMEPGWNATMRQKVLQHLRASTECDGDIFVYSDVDVQFFRPAADFLRNTLERYELACQRDSPDGGILCAGFFACRGNASTRAFWQRVLDLMDRTSLNDQDALNSLRSSIKHTVLPPMFWGPGCHEAKRWVPGQPLHCPCDIVMHHANWTVGVRNKEAQLSAVKHLVAGLTRPYSDS